MSAVKLSPRVEAACADLESAASRLATAPSAVAKAAGEVCASLARLWRQGWAPDPLPPRDLAILRLAHAVLANENTKPKGNPE